MLNYKLGLVWLRRDYRLKDNIALNEAIKNCEKIIICFIYDEHILNKLDPNDQRVTFIMECIREVNHELNKLKSSLIVRYGKPEEKIPEIIETYNVDSIFYYNWLHQIFHYIFYH